MTTPINGDETETFDFLGALLSGGTDYRPALLRSEMDGRDVAVVVAVDANGAEVDMWPCAVLVDEALFARLKPSGDPEVISRG